MSSASLLSHSATPATMGHHSKFKEPLVLFLHSRENCWCSLPSSLPTTSPQTLPSISPLSLGTASGAQRRVLLVERPDEGTEPCPFQQVVREAGDNGQRPLHF